MQALEILQVRRQEVRPEQKKSELAWAASTGKQGWEKHAQEEQLGPGSSSAQQRAVRSKQAERLTGSRAGKSLNGSMAESRKLQIQKKKKM